MFRHHIKKNKLKDLCYAFTCITNVTHMYTLHALKMYMYILK